MLVLALLGWRVKDGGRNDRQHRHAAGHRTACARHDHGVVAGMVRAHAGNSISGSVGTDDEAVLAPGVARGVGSDDAEGSRVPATTVWLWGWVRMVGSAGSIFAVTATLGTLLRKLLTVTE